MVGTISRTARVSVARRNLKPQAKSRPDEQKSHMRQSHSGEKARNFKALNHPEGVAVNAAGVWDEGHANYLGRSAVPHRAKSRCRGNGIKWPVPSCSAEVSRSHSSRPYQSMKGGT